MEGTQSPSLRGRRFAAALALSVLTFEGRASAQQPTPAAAMPPRTYTGLVESVSSQPVSGPATAYPVYNVPCAPEPPVTMGCLDTIRESFCGTGKWRPLTFGSFFSEGWNEPWADCPAGQSGETPRHGWLGAFEGTFYRLWLVNGTYQNDLNKPFGGNGYGGNFAAFVPFSRRFEVYFNAPFISANGTEDRTNGYQSDFGDLQVAASFLLSESAACTQLFTLGATLPTGRPETGGGVTSIFPRYSFWGNPGGSWVVRGGAGVNVPLTDSSGLTTMNTSAAVGRYFRPHDVPFGDLVFYVNCNVVTPLEGHQPTTVGVGPGTRFQIAGNWYFLNYLEVQVAGGKPFDFQVQAAIVKAW